MANINIVAPNPVAALPDVNQVYKAPPKESLFQTGARGILQGATEAADAFRNAEAARKETLMAADLIQSTDPEKAAILRASADDIKAFVPLSTSDASRSVSATNNLRSGLIGEILSHSNRLQDQAIRFQNEQQLIDKRFEKEMAISAFSNNLALQADEIKNKRYNDRQKQALFAEATSTLTESVTNGLIDNLTAGEILKRSNGDPYEMYKAMAYATTKSKFDIQLENQSKLAAAEREIRGDDLESVAKFAATNNLRNASIDGISVSPEQPAGPETVDITQVNKTEIDPDTNQEKKSISTTITGKVSPEVAAAMNARQEILRNLIELDSVETLDNE